MSRCRRPFAPSALSLVPARVGRAVVFERAPRVRGGTRSYAHDGRCLEYTAADGFELAGDIEALAAPAAGYIARELGLSLEAFVRLWTRLEVLAKLLGFSAAHLLQRHRAGRGLPDCELVLRTTVEHGLVISVGWRRRDVARRSPHRPL